MYANHFKRIFDFTVSLLVLILASPIMFLTTIALFFANGGKPFFFQSRPGKNEEIFRIVKFKTMNDKRDAHGSLLPDEQRLTSIGAFVRKFSIDELPQMINVLKGDMSLIGPRPLLVEYLPLYSKEQQRRHDIRPGITGWAQVNGRNTVDWKSKFEMDVWYVDHLSFKLDLKILFLTIKKVLVSEGISGEGTVTMEKFKGNI
ncbi:lipopolysaccharide/colanic/teichoic acid biosynthesis glycosyltransferase [Roseivirga ehrenbergii]|uniref:UDP-galactose phosphate transferase n=2 Tax=Roseivirga ehrenbergii (strain DSM 102268 / JCM 13514 / KCTC 12282 / NCIMB 14502 / KMM 6017) TaxID=279360 RepID=A0A150XEA9_ROSEK|nr:sugar transferase [Roseivirga ehrenbergii]KYG77065.1 UDP-galactose phosphate transferase [Roseivirga ehrenbergii]TCL14432.1 lipopolysaccharide/colanic/teichoic acid biosynthesis glycosyltransferase [Roseivirga ehrenbergii]